MIKVIQRTERKEEIMLMEVDPYTHKGLIEKGKLLVGWKVCRIYDYIGILRCFNCYGFNHFARDCRNERSCRKCAGNHIEKDCKSKENNVNINA